MLRKKPLIGLALGAAVAAFALVSPAGHGPPAAEAATSADYWREGPSELRGAGCEGAGNHFAGGTPVMGSGKSHWDPHPSTRSGPATGTAAVWTASAGGDTDGFWDAFPHGRFTAPLGASTGTC